jgi:hypothetical protein
VALVALLETRPQLGRDYTLEKSLERVSISQVGLLK